MITLKDVLKRIDLCSEDYVFLRNEDFWKEISEGRDIDILVKTSDVCKFLKCLESDGFKVCDYYLSSQDEVFVVKLVEGYLVKLHLKFNYMRFGEPIKAYVLNLNLFKFAKNHFLPDRIKFILFVLRAVFEKSGRKKKYLDFIEKHQSMFLDPLVREYVGQLDLNHIKKGPPLSLRFRMATFLTFLKYPLDYLFKQLRMLGKGKIFRFMGIDGSGKSTIVDSLSVRLHGRVVKFYAGGNLVDPRSPFSLINKLLAPFVGTNLYKYVKVIRYPFGFMEEFVRILYLYYLKLRGYIVLVDRYSDDSKVVSSGESWIVRWFKRNLFSRLYPSPDLVVYVDVDPKIAYSRKGEYGIEKLRSDREEYFSYLKQSGLKYIIIDNSGDLNTTLDNILSKIWSLFKWCV